jgi:hypothetical protein
LNEQNAQLDSWLSGTAFFLLVTLIFWILLMAMTALSGSLQEQLLQLAEGSILYRLSFVNATLIAPAIVIIIVILAFFIPGGSRNRFFEITGVAFLIPYLLLATITYASQYALLPKLLSNMTNSTVDDVLLWYFNNPDSLVYFFDVLGYTFFGVAALFIGLKYVRYSGMLRGIGLLLLGSAVLAILGFIGYVLEVAVLEYALLLSGFLIVPFAILCIILGLRQSYIRGLDE